MKIEEFNNISIAYMRNIGEYGAKNAQLMNDLKDYLRSHHLYDENTIILGIALDDPMVTPSQSLRYDVGIIVDNNAEIELDIRKITDGNYAVFEIQHTEHEVLSFWQNLFQHTMNLHIDKQKPIIERYTMKKVAKHKCEFCIPLKD